MYITRKEIKTEIHAEITREEFCDNYQAMMDDLYNKRIVDTRVLVEKIVKFQELNAEERNAMAQESFNISFGEIHCAVIRYIASNNGFDVDNYGYVDRHTGLLKAVFVQDGAHIEWKLLKKSLLSGLKNK